ncbi:hypothetical protein BAY1663_00930 [Pseudomonas sp. BAY1663]|nr:hypothetical protein BAY1663_00930 [Pseudomonas sp. BAY1663]
MELVYIAASIMIGLGAWVPASASPCWAANCWNPPLVNPSWLLSCKPRPS